MNTDTSLRSDRPGGVPRSRIKSTLMGTTALALVATAVLGSIHQMRAHANGKTPVTVTATAARLVEPAGFADLVVAVRPAVVRIEVTGKAAGPSGTGREFRFSLPKGSPFSEHFRRYFKDMPHGGDKAPSVQGVGSGFIVDPSGLIVTNNHVIDKADRIMVILSDGSRHIAKVKGLDPKTDLAVLKIDANKPLPSVTFGDSAAVRVGDWAIAVGSPFGLGGSVSAGIISARGRDIEAGTLVDFLQIDAPINRGNSGGPLFSATGTVIGINTAIFSPNGGNVGIGFAIPSDLAKKVVNTLIKDGKIKRGWLGVHIQQVDPDIAAGLNLKEARGALVTGVEPDGPAGRAGVQQGDVIIALDGKKLKDVKDLARAVAEHDQGLQTELTLWRDGTKKSLSVKLGAAPDAQVAAAAVADATPKLGLTLAPLGPEARERFGLNRVVQGAVVVDITPDGPAAKAGFRVGDVIRKVGNAAVRTPADVVEQVAKAGAVKRETLLLLVNRDGNDRFVAVKLSQA